MKAYQITDREGYADYSCIVFAETRGKAISLALGIDEFPSCDWDYTQLTAHRVPALDKHYSGHWYMDWFNDEDRLALVKDAGYRCDDDSFDPEECNRCCAKDYCDRYEEYLDEQKCCEFCKYATETEVFGLIECERENGRTKDTDMCCEQWEGR